MKPRCDWWREEQTCALSLVGFGDRRLHASSGRWRSRGHWSCQARPLPTYTALCAIGGKAYLLLRNEAAHTQFETYNFTKNVQRTLWKRGHRKKAFSFCVYFTDSCKICQEILLLFVFRLTGVPSWENVKYYLSHCGDYSHAMSHVRAQWIALHNLGVLKDSVCWLALHLKQSFMRLYPNYERPRYDELLILAKKCRGVSSLFFDCFLQPKQVRYFNPSRVCWILLCFLVVSLHLLLTFPSGNDTLRFWQHLKI